MAQETRRALIFGAGGKLGTALARAFAQGWELAPVPGAGLDVTDKASLAERIRAARPEVVFNAKVVGGVNACERDPLLACQVNTRFPALLAELSAELGFTLVHFSTDAVFPDCAPGQAHTESGRPAPVNLYGLTKFGADCLIPAITPRAYVFRLSVQFGPSPAPSQFLERMLERAISGTKVLRAARDVVSSPSYSLDVAARLRELLETGADFGLYHLASEGQASLYELLERAVRLLGLDAWVEPAAAADFPSAGRRPLATPIRSEKIPPLRPWQEALAEYCAALKQARGLS